MEEKQNGGVARETERDSKMSVSPSPSSSSSSSSSSSLTATTPSPQQASQPVIVEAVPGLGLTLQQVKERAHQKRSNKRAPPMDWSKKNELFSNL